MLVEQRLLVRCFVSEPTMLSVSFLGRIFRLVSAFLARHKLVMNVLFRDNTV